MKRFFLVFAALALILPLSVQAQGSGVELTVFAGYRSGGDFNPVDGFSDIFEPGFEVQDGDVLGAALNIPFSNNLSLELLYSRQDSELFVDEGLFGPNFKISNLDVTYAHVGLQYQWTPGQLRPFVGVGLGFANLSPDGPSLDHENRLSGNFNGGVKIFLSNHLGLRFDGRLFWADLNKFESHDCCCCDDYSNNDLYQAEATAGVVLKF